MSPWLETIKSLRIGNGMTQRQTADALGWKPGDYNRREDGTAPLSVEQLAEIADLFEVTPGELFD